MIVGISLVSEVELIKLKDQILGMARDGWRVICRLRSAEHTFCKI